MGSSVTVTKAFMSNSENKQRLPKGATGIVKSVDKDGAASITFESDQLGDQCVVKKNFDKLEVPSARLPGDGSLDS